MPGDNFNDPIKLPSLIQETLERWRNHILIFFCMFLFLIAGVRYMTRGKLQPDPQITELTRKMEGVAAGLNTLSNDVNSLKENAEDVHQSINRLSTKDILEKLAQTRNDFDKLSDQVAALQRQVISPNNASDILTVARMKDEILARRDFEKKLEASIEKRLKESDDRVAKTEGKLDTIQYWIWGSLITLFTAIVGVAVFLLKELREEVKKLRPGQLSAAASQAEVVTSKAV